MKIEFTTEEVAVNNVAVYLLVCLLALIACVLIWNAGKSSTPDEPIPPAKTVVTNTMVPQSVVIAYFALELLGQTFPPIIVTNFPDVTTTPDAPTPPRQETVVTNTLRHFQIMRSIH